MFTYLTDVLVFRKAKFLYKRFVFDIIDGLISQILLKKQYCFKRQFYVIVHQNLI